jgi:SAM-dependent methyltransferase
MLTKKKINSELKKFTYWYHKINLGHGVTTPGLNLEPIWDNLRKVRNQVNYKDKIVLDIATFDGMFAFEAEKIGAKKVIATDCLYNSLDNFLFCRQILNSKKTKPFFNISPYNLSERLDVFFQEDFSNKLKNYYRKFDIVQHFGLLYHLKDPMISLAEARNVLRTGGNLIIETDVILNNNDSVLVFNGLPNNSRLRNNVSVWWVPTKKCLFEMLEASLFEVKESTYREIFFDVPQNKWGKFKNSKKFQEYKVGRCCVVAKAIPYKKINQKVAKELSRTFRNPGIKNALVIE